MIRAARAPVPKRQIFVSIGQTHLRVFGIIGRRTVAPRLVPGRAGRGRGRGALLRPSALSAPFDRNLRGFVKRHQEKAAEDMATYSVYYMKSEFFGEGLMGYDRLKNNNLLPDPADLTKTHVFLTLVDARNLERVYFKMQGEDWSPTGEARKFVAGKGLRHTSMSVGDVAVDHNSRFAYIVDRMGFRFLGKVTSTGEH